MNELIAKSVARSTTSMLGQQIVTWGSTFLLMLFLPRYLGPVDYGRLYLAQMLTGLFLILIEYDGRYGLAKRIARNREQTAQIISNALYFRLFFWAAAFAALIGASFLLGYPTAVKVLVVIMGVEMLWMSAKTVLVGSFLGREVMQYSALGAVAERLFVAFAGITALFLGANVIVIGLVMVAGTFINFLFCVKHARAMLSRHSLPKADRGGAMTLIREGYPYLLWTVFGVIYYRIDTVMLSMLTPESVVGWYAASYRFFDILAFLPSIYSLAILPVLSKLWGKEDNMLARTTQKSQEFILVAGVPISIAVYFFATNIIDLFFGLEQYGPSVLNLQIFSVGLCLIYIDIVLGTAIIACDRQSKWALASFLAILLNTGLNFFLIPYAQSRYGNGGIGAAIATLVTEFFIMLSAIAILPKELFSSSSVSVSLKALASGAVMAGAILLVRALGPVPWVVQAAAAAAVYLGSILALKTFAPAEIAFGKRFLTVANLKGSFVAAKGENP